MTQEPVSDPYRDPALTDENALTEAYPAGDRPIETFDVTTTPTTAGASTSSDSPDSTADVAKDQAAQVGQSTADAGKHVAGVARDQAGSVAGEARTQARNLADQALSEAQSQAHTQKQRATDGLRSLGEELGSMADRSEQSGTATDLARQASRAAHDAAAWLEQRDPGALLDEVRAFARRRPGAFLGIAAAAGVVAGRMTRGLKAANDSPDHASGTAGSGASDAYPAAHREPRTVSDADAVFPARTVADADDGYLVDPAKLSEESR